MNWLMVATGVVGLTMILAGNFRWGIIVLGTSIGGLVGEFMQSHVFLPHKVKKLYAQYKGITSPITYEWDAERLIGSSERGHGEKQWKDYAKVRENNRVFLLYITDYLFEVVPKEWFSESEKLEEFRKFANGGCEI